MTAPAALTHDHPEREQEHAAADDGTGGGSPAER
jgi:hypothetical protein